MKNGSLLKYLLLVFCLPPIIITFTNSFIIPQVLCGQQAQDRVCWNVVCIVVGVTFQSCLASIKPLMGFFFQPHLPQRGARHSHRFPPDPPAALISFSSHCFVIFDVSNLRIAASQRCISFAEFMFHRVQTFPRAQILQEFTYHCHQLAENDNRGFKLEFEVMSTF